MGVLEQILLMKKQGVSNEEIVTELSQQGVSPKEIDDAIKQAQIKNAVGGQMENLGMEQSVALEEEVPIPIKPEKAYKPRTYEEEPSYTPSPIPQEYQQQAYSPQQAYYPPETTTYAGGIDTDTAIEISDQIFSDRIKKFQNQLDALSEASALSQAKTDNMLERLRKIENIMDKLQIAILEKIGSYGQNLEGIKKEMSMMQDSFSKAIPSFRETKTGETKKSDSKNLSLDEQGYPIESKNSIFEQKAKPVKKLLKRK